MEIEKPIMITKKNCNRFSYDLFNFYIVGVPRKLDYNRLLEGINLGIKIWATPKERRNIGK